MLEEGTVLVREGHAGRALFFIEEGSLNVSVNGVDVSTVEKGACIGEVSLTVCDQTTATVKAASKVGPATVTTALAVTILSLSPSRSVLILL